MSIMHTKIVNMESALLKAREIQSLYRSSSSQDLECPICIGSMYDRYDISTDLTEKREYCHGQDEMKKYLTSFLKKHNFKFMKYSIIEYDTDTGAGFNFYNTSEIGGTQHENINELIKFTDFENVDLKKYLDIIKSQSTNATSFRISVIANTLPDMSTKRGLLWRQIHPTEKIPTVKNVFQNFSQLSVNVEATAKSFLNGLQISNIEEKKLQTVDFLVNILEQRKEDATALVDKLLINTATYNKNTTSTNTINTNVIILNWFPWCEKSSFNFIPEYDLTSKYLKIKNHYYKLIETDDIFEKWQSSFEDLLPQLVETFDHMCCEIEIGYDNPVNLSCNHMLHTSCLNTMIRTQIKTRREYENIQTNSDLYNMLSNPQQEEKLSTFNADTQAQLGDVSTFELAYSRCVVCQQPKLFTQYPIKVKYNGTKNGKKNTKMYEDFCFSEVVINPLKLYADSSELIIS